MKIYGSIIANLESAVASARRLRGHPVYKETLIYWTDLLHEARRLRQDQSLSQAGDLETAIVKLEIELAERNG